jgi:hypothetical protein
MLLVGACGGGAPIPKRGVVEGDLGSWKFRRFQGPLLDVEAWIDGNKGVAHSASYITASSEKTGHITDKDLVNVTVTKYEKKDGVVRETVRLVRRLAAEKGYQVDEKKVKGVRALRLTGPSETWVMWPATSHVVKVGGRGREEVPKSMVERYASRYPSKLPGGSLEGPLPPGPDEVPKEAPKAEYDPKNPKPDLDKYDPNRVKLPEQRKGEPGEDGEDGKDAKDAKDTKDGKGGKGGKDGKGGKPEPKKKKPR